MKERSSKAGMPPGSVVYIGEARQDKPLITVIEYDENGVDEFIITDVSDLTTHISSEKVSWINIDGVHDIDLIKQVGEIFDIHPLVLEDIVNTDHRPKIEEYDTYLYSVVRMLSYIDGITKIDSEQVSFLLGEHYVISFQEKTEDVFQPIRNRIETGQGLIRKSQADYLFYALVDVMVSNYFLSLEKVEDKIEMLEDAVNKDLNSGTLDEIHDLKKDLITIRKATYPLREVVNFLDKRPDLKLIRKKTRVYLRDLYDLIFHVVELSESYRDSLSSVHDLHLALNGHKMNQIMQLLTIVSTIFIPLTFIAGIYGMNFDIIPELHWKYGYLYFWGLMIVIGVVLLMYFRRRKWL